MLAATLSAIDRTRRAGSRNALRYSCPSTSGYGLPVGGVVDERRLLRFASWDEYITENLKVFYHKDMREWCWF
jgi:hypothetical protein